LFGLEQVCVEAERENEISDPDQCGDASTGWDHSAVKSTQKVNSIFGDRFDAWEIVSDGGTTYVSRPFGTLGQYTDEPETYSCIVEKGINTRDNPNVRLLMFDSNSNSRIEYFWDSDTIEISNEDAGAIGEFGREIITENGPNGGRVVYIWFNFTPSIPNDDRRLLLYHPRRTNEGDTGIVHFVQYEESAYPTLPVEGTRPAPSSVIENALPETGTVGFVTNIIKSSEKRVWLFWNPGSDSLVGRFEGSFFTSGAFVMKLGDENFVESNVLNMNDNREKIALFGTYNNTDGLVCLLKNNGDIIKGHVTSNTPEPYTDIELSRTHTSLRFEKIFHKDNIVRVNATDEEIKAFFEDLVKGTSMEMSAEDMVIV